MLLLAADQSVCSRPLFSSSWADPGSENLHWSFFNLMWPFLIDVNTLYILMMFVWKRSHWMQRTVQSWTPCWHKFTALRAIYWWLWWSFCKSFTSCWPCKTAQSHKVQLQSDILTFWTYVISFNGFKGFISSTKNIHCTKRLEWH